MKNIEKRIRSLVFEMVTIVLIVIVSYFVWDNIDYSNEAQIAYAYSNYNTMINVIMNNNIKVLSPTADEESSELDTVDYTLTNSNSVAKDYNLFIKYDNKNSNLDKNYLKVNYEGKTFYLNSLKTIERDGYSFYLLTSDTIEKKSSEKDSMILYLAEETPSTEQNKTLSFSLYAEEI